MDKSLAPYINVLARYCGVRDVPELTCAALRDKYGFDRADAAVLFGGSIMCGGDVFADAMRENVARTYIIVGGEGHTTGALREKMRGCFPDWDTERLQESELYDGYLRREYGLRADYIETRSTNCGNNITFLLKLLDENSVGARSVILIQDATMQRRMAATLRKYRPDITAVSFASYSVAASDAGGEVGFIDPPRGMWSAERYAALLTGEIPRLRDDADGYGPNGKNFLAHEDVPDDVLDAYRALVEYDAGLVREARPEFERPVD